MATVFCAIFLGLYLLWVLYLASMNLIASYEVKKIGIVGMIFGMPVVLFGIIIDCLINITVMTLVFLQLPKQWLLTDRLKTLIRTDLSWRGDLALWICKNLLNPFDHTGDHCD